MQRVMRHGGLVCLGGDFNVVLLGSERSSRGVLDAGDLSFQQFVQDSNLLDLPLTNGEYTWFSSRNEGLWSRLDRWLVSEEVMRNVLGLLHIFPAAVLLRYRNLLIAVRSLLFLLLMYAGADVNFVADVAAVADIAVVVVAVCC